MDNSFFEQINTRITNPSKNYLALHGTSLFFLDKLIANNGEIKGRGHFGNEFYVLKKRENWKESELLESATYYANVNAIKDSLYRNHPNIFQTIEKEKLDPYLFLVGLGDLLSDVNKSPTGFAVFSDSEMAQIRSDITQAHAQDRKGIIIFFAESLQTHFKIETDSLTAQAKIILDRPIPLTDICAITLLGKYEQEYWSEKKVDKL